VSGIDCAAALPTSPRKKLSQETNVIETSVIATMDLENFEGDVAVLMGAPPQNRSGFPILR
jgi:hypothetical protein